MDEPIISRAMIRACGADAFDRGLGIDDHNMNPGSAAIADWQAGWVQRRAEAKRVVQQLVEVSPP